MRVLICDQETEMLETIAREFEVDVATSKATCIDLMRANPFDVLVASERLSDGSGLELLSHVATRWPDTLRVLVMEPARMKLLRGKLAPFRLHATLKYPVDLDELERTLNALSRLLGDEEAEEPEPPPPPPVSTAVKVQKVQPAQQAMRPSSPATSGSASSPKSAATPAARTAAAPSAARGTTHAKSNSRTPAPLGAPGGPAPVKRRLGNYTPLGSPDDSALRIVEREFDHSAAPLAARAIRTREEANRPRTPSEKAKGLATHLSNSLKRLLKR